MDDKVKPVIENLEIKKKLDIIKHSVHFDQISCKNAIKEYKEKIAYEKGYRAACMDIELMINKILEEDNKNDN